MVFSSRVPYTNPRSHVSSTAKAAKAAKIGIHAFALFAFFAVRHMLERNVVLSRR
jgi:hypothetical protein